MSPPLTLCGDFLVPVEVILELVKTPRRKQQDKLWELCKQIIRAKYVNDDGSWSCYTCRVRIEDAKFVHTGHFIASSLGGVTLRYSLENLRPQCIRCNIHLGGNGAEFYRQLVIHEGQAYVDNLFLQKQITAKADTLFFTSKIEKYEKTLAIYTRSSGDTLKVLLRAD